MQVRLNRGSLPAILDSEVPREDLKAYVGTYLQEEIRAEGLTRSVEDFSRFFAVAGACNGEQVNYTAVGSDAGVPPRTGCAPSPRKRRAWQGGPTAGRSTVSVVFPDGGRIMNKVNLRETLASFEDTWVPKVVAELNGQFVKVARCRGEYVWHAHEHEDEAFLVVEGRLEIHLRDGVVSLGPGELFVVPRGVEHKPVAEEDASIVLFEPATTRNTGAVDHRYTIEPDRLERI